MNILDCLDDPKVFGPYFQAETWRPWRVFLAALFGLPLTPEQLAIYRKHTGRGMPPSVPSHEAWLCIGRRGGKSFILAAVAVFLASFRDWRPFLGPGEVATIMIIARDRRQARVIKRFITGLLHEVPMLRRTVIAETRESIQLKNRVSIEIHTASFHSTRGYTIVAALLDEVAFWETDAESAEPDVEVISAIKPGMATIPGAMLLCASSPHARRGALWDAHRQHFGRDDDPVLVWQAATRDMNATVPQSYIDKHAADDPARAAAEYGAIFRTDIEAFLPREVVEACLVPGRRELPPVSGVSYVAFVDPSGGSAASMTLGIAHRGQDGHVVLDAVRERRPPFSPESVATEFAALLKSYGVHKVTGDRHGGEWLRERFAVHGIQYEIAEKPKSDIYRSFLPLLNDGRAELLDVPHLISQLIGLERTVSKSGKELIGPAPNVHDDVANAVAGALVLALEAAPALWRGEHFLVDGKAAPPPQNVLALYCVLVGSASGQLAVAFFQEAWDRQKGRKIVHLADIDLKPLVPQSLRDAHARMNELYRHSEQTIWGHKVFAQGVVSDQLDRILGRNVGVERIDSLLATNTLALQAALHIGAGAVSVAAAVLSKPLPLGFLDGAPGNDDDILRQCVLAGIVALYDGIPVQKRPSVNANLKNR
jgi:hypothetical protein